MKIGLPTTLFINDAIQQCVKKLIKLKPECIEIVHEIPNLQPQLKNKKILSEVKDTLKSNKLEVSVHSCFYELNLGSSYHQIRNLTINQVKKSIDVCYFLEGKVTTVHPGYFPIFQLKNLYTKAYNRFVRSMRECEKYGEDRGMTISIENIQAPHYFCFKLEDLLLLTERIENLRVTLDIGHAYIMKNECKCSNPELDIASEIKTLLRDVLIHIHIHDNMGIRDNHLVPGEGKINFPPIIKAIKEIGYNNQVIVESWNPSNSEETGKRGMRAVRELLKRY
jgi:sugar phosphate isomerase/epimerase